MKTYLKFLARNRVYTFISIFGLAVSLMFVILMAVLSVGIQIWRAARVNPVESLHVE